MDDMTLKDRNFFADGDGATVIKDLTVTGASLTFQRPTPVGDIRPTGNPAGIVAPFIGKDLDGVIIRDIGGPVTDDSNENGGCFQLSVAIGYEHDQAA